MYGVAGEKATGHSKIGRFFTNFADPRKSERSIIYITSPTLSYVSRYRVVQLYPPAKSFEWILMYGIAGSFINKYFNYADTNVRVGEVSTKPTDLSATGRFFSCYTIH